MARPPASYLRDTHPDIAAQLIDQSLLTNLGTGSAKKVEWRCPTYSDHTWHATVYNRTNSKSGGTGCPICANKIVKPGFNDIATTHPEAADLLADQSLRTKITANSNKKQKFQCSDGHTWTAPPSRITTQGSGCPQCSGRTSIAGKNDLLTTHPDIASQLVDQSLATKLKAGSNRKVQWRCPINPDHTWTVDVYARTTKKTGCPHCSGRIATPGFTDLATTHPKVAAQLVDPSLAATLKRSTGKKVLWQCTRYPDHQWTASPESRAQNNSDCPICDNKTVLPGYNDIATTDPDIAAELLNPHIAHTITRGSGRVVDWVCPNNEEHIWQCAPYQRTAPEYKRQCPTCYGQSSFGEIDLFNVVTTLLQGRGLTIHRSVRGVLPQRYELDIYIPELNIAIEYNGVYWHSDAVRIDKNYHASKTALAREKGIHIIHVWEDDWQEKRDIIIRGIAHKIKATENLHRVISHNDNNISYTSRVFARKTTVKRIKGAIAAKFYTNNHIQGPVSATYHYALINKDNDICAVLSVGKPRNNIRRGGYIAGQWDIKRYATACTVVGGFTKLMTHAERDIRQQGEDITSWVSYSAHDISDGSLYRDNGFTIDGVVAPDYTYVGEYTRWKRASKSAFQKRFFRDTPDLLWQPEWTESQCAEANKLYRIHDAGKTRWIKAVD